MNRQPWRTITILTSVLAAAVCAIIYLPTPVLAIGLGWLGTSLLFAGLWALIFTRRWDRIYRADLDTLRRVYAAQVVEEAERIANSLHTNNLEHDDDNA